MPKPILRSKTTDADILVYDQGDDLQVTCGDREFWFTYWPQDPVESVSRAVEEMASRMNVQILEFCAPLA
jgi:hypothetical protein